MNKTNGLQFMNMSWEVFKVLILTQVLLQYWLKTFVKKAVTYFHILKFTFIIELK